MADRTDVEFAVGIAVLSGFVAGPGFAFMGYNETASIGIGIAAGIAAFLAPFLHVGWICVGFYVANRLTDTVYEMVEN